jgi:hypothetical protein
MRASSARTWVVSWTHALAALLFAVVALLWASSEASAAAGVSGHFGTLATHAYDAPVHVYDGGAHSVQAHTSEAAPFASLDLAGGAQGMVATVTGPLSVVSSKSVAANTGGTGVLRHYTTDTAASGISETGQIVPGSSSGKIWLTTDEYATGADAQASLALPKTPAGYYEIPVCRVQCPVGPSPVQPWPAPPAQPIWPGGGSEITTTFPINVSDLPFNRLGG